VFAPQRVSQLIPKYVEAQIRAVMGRWGMSAVVSVGGEVLPDDAEGVAVAVAGMGWDGVVGVEGEKGVGNWVWLFGVGRGKWRTG
jgi:hypothetical protein